MLRKFKSTFSSSASLLITFFYAVVLLWLMGLPPPRVLPWIWYGEGLFIALFILMLSVIVYNGIYKNISPEMMADRMTMQVFFFALTQFLLGLALYFPFASAREPKLVFWILSGATILSLVALVNLLDWMKTHKQVGYRIRTGMFTLVSVIGILFVVNAAFFAAIQTHSALNGLTHASLAVVILIAGYSAWKWKKKGVKKPYQLFNLVLLVGMFGALEATFAFAMLVVLPSLLIEPIALTIVGGTFLTATTSILAWYTRLAPGYEPQKKTGGGMENG